MEDDSPGLSVYVSVSGFFVFVCLLSVCHIHTCMTTVNMRSTFHLIHLYIA